MAKNEEKNEGVKIKVVGIGGGGCNAVERMLESGIEGVEFIAINTDLQALERSHATNRIQIGPTLTKGLGSGGDPEKGRAAAEESKNEVRKALDGADMVFIAAGLGGGTGTGGAPLVAEVARELGALSVAVVTKPFRFEGVRRVKLAEQGLENLMGHVDTVIAIPNDRIKEVVEMKATMAEAFRKVNEVLHHGVQGLVEIITKAGNINVDFEDVRTIMQNAGPALMGIGYGVGQDRAIQAAESAVRNKLVDVDIKGAKGVLVNIACSDDMTISEFNEAMTFIQSLCDQNDANIITGYVIDPSLQGELRITLLATGFDPTSHQQRLVVDTALGDRSEDTSVKVQDRAVTAVRDHATTPVVDATDYEVPAFIRENRPRQV